MKSPVPELADLRQQCLNLLARGAADKKDPLHTLCLITVGQSGADGRMVVFRKWHTSPYGIEIHTDVRNAKWAELQAQPAHTWVGWHPRKNVQLRIRAGARLHTADDLAAARWKNVPLAGRINYGADGVPGSPIPHPPEAVPFGGDFTRFGVIISEVQSIDWLWLRKEGHLRARFQWEGDCWRETWLIP